MRFAAIAVATGLVGAFFATSLQGTLTGSVAEAAPQRQSNLSQYEELDGIETGGIQAAAGSSSDALRLIDLRSGTTCRTSLAVPSGTTFTDAPLGRDCKASPSLARIVQWRSTEDGSLIMADSEGSTILEFAPGDGVLYESVYPSDQLITIVPARS